MVAKGFSTDGCQCEHETCVWQPYSQLCICTHTAATRLAACDAPNITTKHNVRVLHVMITTERRGEGMVFLKEELTSRTHAC